MRPTTATTTAIGTNSCYDRADHDCYTTAATADDRYHGYDDHGHCSRRYDRHDR
jgi:hypothetical protein